MAFVKKLGIIFAILTCTTNSALGLDCYTCLSGNNPIIRVAPIYNPACSTTELKNVTLKTCNSGEQCIKISLQGQYNIVLRQCQVPPPEAKEGCENTTKKTELEQLENLIPSVKTILGGSLKSASVCVCNMSKCDTSLPINSPSSARAIIPTFFTLSLSFSFITYFTGVKSFV